RELPGHPDDLRRPQLPDALVAAVRECNENLRAAIIDPGELMMFVPSLRRRTDGEQLVAALLEALTEPVEVDGLPHHLSPRIGAVMLDNESSTIEMLLEGARLASNECTSAQPGMMFHPYQRVRNERRLEMEDDLRAAIRDEEIMAALQPAFDIATGRLVACEAFARWNRTDKGPVPAIEFVHLAHEIGVGHLLGRQVLDRSLALLGDLTGDRGSERAEPLTLWLNVSPDEVLHPGFAPTIADAVGANPGIKVGLELSPTPPGDAHDIIQVLRDLAVQGVRVAIGDFGIGNANLTILQQLPFDAVKLDRALIRQIAGSEAAAELVGALVELGKLLRLETTAQGVENEAQLEVLRRLGCAVGQGFLYAEPTDDPATIAAWLQA
ncbi:MAG: EAL domain-containing protein, partial [Acidimicrobiia bacterium]|nr:EAL domain-containing protein [Acidimicrobiia bacterium]